MMMVSSNNILKRFGVWVTAWTRYIPNLQTRFFVIFLISSGLTFCVYATLFFFIESYFKKEENRWSQNEYQQIKEITAELQIFLKTAQKSKTQDFLISKLTKNRAFYLFSPDSPYVIELELDDTGFDIDLDTIDSNQGFLIDEDGINYFSTFTKGNSQYQVISISKNEFLDELKNFFHGLLLLFCLIFFAILFYFFSKSIRNDLNLIITSVKRIIEGDLEKKDILTGQDEIALLSDNIDVMRQTMKENLEDIQRRERSRKELITGMSHDLKTPLTSMIGYAQLVVEAEERALILPDIIKNAKLFLQKSLHLKALIQDLFTYAKYSSQSIVFNPQSFSLQLMLIQKIDEFITEFQQKGIKIKFTTPEEPCTIVGDPLLLERVFDNIFNNLRKYTTGKKQIFISLNVQTNFYEILVKNTSEFYLKTNLDYLLETMVRGDQSRGETEVGSGLGLAICQEIIELHKGSIHLFYKEESFHLQILLPTY